MGVGGGAAEVSRRVTWAAGILVVWRAAALPTPRAIPASWDWSAAWDWPEQKTPERRRCSIGTEPSRDMRCPC